MHRLKLADAFGRTKPLFRHREVRNCFDSLKRRKTREALYLGRQSAMFMDCCLLLTLTENTYRIFFTAEYLDTSEFPPSPFALVPPVNIFDMNSPNPSSLSNPEYEAAFLPAG